MTSVCQSLIKFSRIAPCHRIESVADLPSPLTAQINHRIATSREIVHTVAKEDLLVDNSGTALAATAREHHLFSPRASKTVILSPPSVGFRFSNNKIASRRFKIIEVVRKDAEITETTGVEATKSLSLAMLAKTLG